MQFSSIGSSSYLASHLMNVELLTIFLVLQLLLECFHLSNEFCEQSRSTLGYGETKHLLSDYELMVSLGVRVWGL